jgi:protein tyrosine/serine phosphatase
VDRFVKGCTDADFIDPKTIFNEGEKDIMLFFGDETEERLQEIEANKPLACDIKGLGEFNIAEKQDRADITNFRLVPGTTTLYRSYHPYYPSHSQTYLKDKDIPTEYVRIEELKKLIEEKGIKTDINLCQDRSDKVGSTYTVYNYDTPFRIDIPNCYKNIQNNNRVLYVGDKTAVVPGNDVIPEGEHVYYNSDSQYMLDWVKQIVDFINMDNSKAPFLIHCEIGVDRTGVFSAIFAGLCGASWEEIAEDYKMSNRMQIGEFRDVNVLEYSFERMLGVEDITKESDIKSLLVNYFTTKGGMTQTDLDKTVQKLTSAQ